jgi:hypothetical protein
MPLSLHAFGSPGRVRPIVAAAVLVGGSVLAVGASAGSALASTPAQLVITTTSPLTATAGSAYVAKLDATGGTKPYTWSLTDKTSLPAGLVLHASTGQITGTPLGPGGTFGFTAEVTDSENPAVSATASESITVVVNPLTVLTAALPDAAAGVAYSQTLTATGGVSPYSWSIALGSLPAGLVLHAASGVISGTTKVGGNFTFTAQVTDSETTPQSVGAPESITVDVAGLVVTTGSTLPTATSGVPYSVKLGAAGGVTPYAWTLSSGSLPAGLKLAKSGLLSGTPTATGGSGGGPQPGYGAQPGGGGQPGPDTFTVQVTDSEAPTVSATENVSLYVVTPMVIPTTLPGASLGASYDQPLQPTGGLGPYSYAITAGALPNGLALQTDGEITGQATADGASNFTVSVTDSENPPATVTQAESITVTQPVIYVATDGSDSNPGTQMAPFQTIGAALTLASSFTNPVIDVAGGTYNEGSGISLISNVTISGGYSEGAWTQTSSTPTTITGSPQAALADGVTGVSINDVTLAPVAPAALGSSVYGLRAINGSSVALTGVAIDTPNAAPGAPGSLGSAGQAGDNGTQGGSGSGCSGAGAVGGGGGSGGTNFAAGGQGGVGGTTYTQDGLVFCGGAGSPGSPGSGGASGGGGGGEENMGSSGTQGSAGANGAPGQVAFFGPGLAGTEWAGEPGNAGGAGRTGSGGGGGGGGGGEGCFGLCTNTLGTGGGGGGGGGGGTGGSAGGGGGAGGGSFGIYLWASSATLVSTTVNAGNGGQGGAGGNGGNGGGNGGGGGGGAGGNGVGGGGGVGGNGGNGGAGGGGSGAPGGPSAAIFLGNGSTFTPDSASVLNWATSAPGGAGGSGSGTPAQSGEPGFAGPTLEG